MAVDSKHPSAFARYVLCGLILLVLPTLLGMRAARSEVSLTAAERAWIARHPVVRVAGDRAFPPVEFIARDGSFQGIAVDYLARVEAMTGLRFRFDPESAWSEAVAKLEARQLDMFSAAAATPERRAFATFTPSYLPLPAMIFTRANVNFLDGLTGLEGRRVAAVKGYAVTEYLRDQRQHGFELVETATVADALAELQAGRIDAYVGSILVTGYYLRREGFTNIQVSGQLPFQIDIAMAARSDWPELHSILSKALGAITEAERNAINGRWMGLQIKQPPDYRRLWQATLLGGFILLLILGWNWYLRRTTASQRRELEANNRALRREVEERRRAEDLARAANDAKTRLLANMSHEFRTPLNAIIGFSALLRNGVAGPLGDRRQSGYVNDIFNAGQHMLALVNDTLDLSTIEAQRLSLHEEPVALGAVVRDVVRLLRSRAFDAAVSLECAEGQRPLPETVCDERRIRQVLINLIDNAIKFTPAGGRIDVSYRWDDDRSIVISVADTGIGMTEEEIGSAFNPFDRGPDPFVRSSEGAGLGLPLARDILLLHGGTLELSSRPGEGTTATLKLPPSRVVDVPARTVA